MLDRVLGGWNAWENSYSDEFNRWHDRNEIYVCSSRPGDCAGSRRGGVGGLRWLSARQPCEDGIHPCLLFRRCRLSCTYVTAPAFVVLAERRQSQRSFGVAAARVFFFFCVFLPLLAAHLVPEKDFRDGLTVYLRRLYGKPKMKTENNFL